MQDILSRVQSFLLKAGEGGAECSPQLLEEFKELCGKAFMKHFSPKEPRVFTLRGSNLGKPSCQLQAEKLGFKEEPLEYHHVMKMFMGDLVEAAAVTIMKAAGVPIDEKSGKVEYKTDKGTFSGEFDIDAYGKIWDVKSASPFSFTYKFASGDPNRVVGDGDAFGYQGQGVFYSTGKEKPFGGWIAICKSTGQWAIAEINDADYTEFVQKGTATIHGNIDKLTSMADFRRCFTDEAETFRRKETGNRVLNKTCGFCKFKWACWPELQYLPARASQAERPEYKYYTFIAPKVEVEDTISQSERTQSAKVSCAESPEPVPATGT